MKTSTYAPFAKPLYVMVKPVGAVCNLACDYCYYLEKANLYKDNPKHVMSDELLEKFIDEYINSQTGLPHFIFTIFIVKFLRSINRNAYQPVIFSEELAPFIGQHGSVGLDAVIDRSSAGVFLLQFH